MFTLYERLFPVLYDELVFAFIPSLAEIPNKKKKLLEKCDSICSKSHFQPIHHKSGAKVRSVCDVNLSISSAVKNRLAMKRVL